MGNAMNDGQHGGVSFSNERSSRAREEAARTAPSQRLHYVWDRSSGAANPQNQKNCDLIIYGGGRLGVSTFKNDLTLYSKIIFLAVGVELNLCGGARRRILFYRSHVR